MKWVDVSYQYLIDEESSFGINAAYEFSDQTNFEYALTPYYRRYFSEKFACFFCRRIWNAFFSKRTYAFLGL